MVHKFMTVSGENKQVVMVGLMCLLEAILTWCNYGNIPLFQSSYQKYYMYITISIFLSHAAGTFEIMYITTEVDSL